MPANFVWYELMTTDMGAAEAFYRAVVGWGAQPAGLSPMPYTLLTVEGNAVAGLMTLPAEAAAAGAKPGWVGYVGVDDVDAMAERVTAAGGAIRKAPCDIPGVGRFASVADPSGAGFVLFKGTMPEPPASPAPGTPGTFGWHELHGGDLARDFAFYAGLFGWTKDQAIDIGPAGTYQLFAAGGPAIGGMMTKMAETPRPVWHYYVNVPECDAAAARVAAAGGQVLMGPHEVPGGSWILHGLDPQGAAFALVAPRR